MADTQNEDGSYSVTSPTGATFPVLTEDEFDYYRERASRYTSDNHFTNVSDLQDLDRLLVMELMCWRWGLWLSQERDYWGQEVDLDTLQKNLSEYSKELRLVKKSMGIDKPQREKERGESAADYLENLRIRAREFGVMRESQLTKCITLFQELKSLLVFHDNCTDDERRENNIELHDILDWIRTIAVPEFDEIDTHFRANNQRFWVKSI